MRSDAGAAGSSRAEVKEIGLETFAEIRARLGLRPATADKAVQARSAEEEAQRAKELQRLEDDVADAIAVVRGERSMLAKMPEDEWHDLLRPIVIEFCGSPRSGKTTCIEVIEHLFRRNDCSTSAPLEGARLTPDFMKKKLVAFNAYTLCYAIPRLLEECLKNDKAELVLLDRGPFDSLAWMKNLEEQGKLAKDNLDVVEKFAALSDWATYIDYVLILTCDAEESRKRELAVKLTQKDGRVTGTEGLQALLNQYKKLPDRIMEKTNHPDVALIDTTHESDPTIVAFAVTGLILGAFRKRKEALRAARERT